MNFHVTLRPKPHRPQNHFFLFGYRFKKGTKYMEKNGHTHKVLQSLAES